MEQKDSDYEFHNRSLVNIIQNFVTKNAIQ